MTRDNKRQRYIAAIASLCICICIGAIGLVGVFANHAEQAYAFNAFEIKETDTVSIGELLWTDTYDADDNGAKVFNKFQFDKLIDAMRSGSEQYTAIANLSNKNAGDLRAINGGKDIVVTIDGKQWTVTDLHKLADGRVIATMWLASSTEMSEWSNNWFSNDATYTYPSNMYSTSYIRANALNSGGCGYVATEADAQGAGKLTPIEQNASHPYAKFTMGTVESDKRNLSLTKYIVCPIEVDYQQSETIRAFDSSYSTSPNEAWGRPELESYYGNDNKWDYSKKGHYAEWSTDYLWLPSLAETGYSGKSGIWNLSDNQRKNENKSWLRTGRYNVAYGACFLDESGAVNTADTAVSKQYSVRPAFHLDLTAAEQAAGLDLPTDETVTYDGTSYKLADREKMPTWYSEAIYGDATRVSVEYSADSVIDAGTYEVTLKLLDSALAWKTNKPDAGNGETDRIRKFRIQIDPRKLSIDWSGLQAQYVWDANLQSSLANYAPTFSGAIAADGVTLSVSYDTDVADLAKIGRHTITATMSATDPTRFAKNYNILSALSKTYTVDKATQVAQNITIDYERELLIESAAQTNGANRLAWLEYKDRGGNWVSVARADGSGGYELAIVEDMMRGADVEFRYRVPGELAEYVDDLTFTHAIPARPTGAEAPTLQYATETATVRSGYRYAFGQTDAPTAYEVSTGIAIELAPLGGTSYIADYGATEYKIYYYAPATSTSFHSEIGALTIPARSEAPKLTINYIGEKTMERVLPDVTYTLRDGAEQTGDGNYIDLAPDGDIGILVAWRVASDAAFASTKLQLTIPARPNAPQIVYDQDAGDYTSAEIPTTAMVYRSMAPNANWSAVPTDGLKFRRGQYQFRYKAVADDGSGNGAFASLECSIDYGNATVNLLAQWSLPGKEVGVTETVYNGGIQYPSVQFYELVNGNRAPVEIAAELIHMTVTALRSGNTLAGAMGTVGVSDADTYSVEIDIRTAAGVHDTGYQITENNAVTITVAPMKLRVPSMSELRIVYNGKTQALADHLPNYLDGLVTITGASEKKDVLPDDAYTAYLTLIRRDNYVWTQDGEELADARCAVQWNITPYELTPDWDKLSFRYQDGVVQRPQVASFGLPTDMAAEEELLKQALTGDWQNTILVGQYTVQLWLDAAILGDLYDNYALVETSVTYRITLGSNGEGNRVEWLEVSGTFRRKYYAGNRFDDTGMIVEAIYSDGTRKEVEYTLGEIVRTQSGAAIAVRYEDASQLGEDGKPVVVEQLVEVTLIEIVEIRLSGTYKTEYAAGDKFNATGLIVEAVYEDGYAEEVRKYEISDNALQKGDVAVTVSYTVLDRTYTADAAITVGGADGWGDAVPYAFYIAVIAMSVLSTGMCVWMLTIILRWERSRKSGNRN